MEQWMRQGFGRYWRAGLVTGLVARLATISLQVFMVKFLVINVYLRHHILSLIKMGAMMYFSTRHPSMVVNYLKLRFINSIFLIF
tara:strand:+ start:655 stop:909 length:255 start_codon:yes stop_codon:yes gene_type:complete